jgi:hypothetical protein
MTRVAALATVALALVVAGCGGDHTDKKLSGALGGSGDADTAQLRDYLQEVHLLGDTDTAIVTALRTGDRKGAGAAIERLRRMSVTSGELARDFEGERLRTFSTDYSKAIGGLAVAYQRVTEAPDDADKATVKRLIRGIATAKAPLQRLDGKLLETIRTIVPPDKYDEMVAKAKRSGAG